MDSDIPAQTNEHIKMFPVSSQNEDAYIFGRNKTWIVPKVSEEFFEHPVLTLNCLDNDLHHVCAVIIGMIWKRYPSHDQNSAPFRRHWQTEDNCKEDILKMKKVKQNTGRKK